MKNIQSFHGFLARQNLVLIQCAVEYGWVLDSGEVWGGMAQLLWGIDLVEMGLEFVASIWEKNHQRSALVPFSLFLKSISIVLIIILILWPN